MFSSFIHTFLHPHFPSPVVLSFFHSHTAIFTSLCIFLPSPSYSSFSHTSTPKSRKFLSAAFVELVARPNILIQITAVPYCLIQAVNSAAVVEFSGPFALLSLQLRLSSCSATNKWVLLGEFAWVAGKGEFVIIRCVHCFCGWWEILLA